MKYDHLFETSCLFADLVFLAILCCIAVLGTATMAGQLLVGICIGIGIALLFLLCMRRIRHTTGKKPAPLTHF